MTIWDVMADDELFDRLLCTIIVLGIVVALVIRSFKNDKDA